MAWAGPASIDGAKWLVQLDHHFTSLLHAHRNQPAHFAHFAHRAHFAQLARLLVCTSLVPSLGDGKLSSERRRAGVQTVSWLWRGPTTESGRVRVWKLDAKRRQLWWEGKRSRPQNTDLEEAREALADYIKLYNSQRLHSSLAMKTPDQFSKEHAILQ